MGVVYQKSTGKSSPEPIFLVVGKTLVGGNLVGVGQPKHIPTNHTEHETVKDTLKPPILPVVSVLANLALVDAALGEGANQSLVNDGKNLLVLNGLTDIVSRMEVETEVVITNHVDAKVEVVVRVHGGYCTSLESGR